MCLGRVGTTMTRPASWHRFEMPLLFGVLMLLSARLLASTAWKHLLFSDYSPLLYQAGTLAFNYVEFGAVRRGLGGTFVHAIGGDLLHATAVFHLLSAAAVSAVACCFVARLEHPVRRATFVVLLVALVMRWAEDAGRTDMAVAAVLGSSVLALRAGRPVLAGTLVALGLGVHETSFVYGIPLLLGLALELRLWRTVERRALLGAGAVIVAGLVVYLLLDRMPRADVQTMADTVRSRLPRRDEVDWAIYYAVSGGRGVRTSLCQNATDPNYWMHIAGGLIVIALFVFVLGVRGPALWRALLVSVPPFAFLAWVANDHSRWTVLAAFNVWLFCAARRQPEGADWPRWRPLLAVVAILVLHPKTWPVESTIYVPTPVLEHLVQRFGGPRTPSVQAALAICDPAWRSVLQPERAKE